MTANEFRQALAEFDRTGAEFAERVGIYPVTLSRRLSEERVPAWAEWIISLLRERRENVGGRAVARHAAQQASRQEPGNGRTIVNEQ